MSSEKNDIIRKASKVELSLEMVRDFVYNCKVDEIYFDQDYKKKRANAKKAVKYLKRICQKLKGRENFGTFEIVFSCLCKETYGEIKK